MVSKDKYRKQQDQQCIILLKVLILKQMQNLLDSYVMLNDLVLKFKVNSMLLLMNRIYQNKNFRTHTNKRGGHARRFEVSLTI